jgi:hypothetical protein
MNTKPATIDLMPTFAEATHTCMMVLENGSPRGKQMARDELLRYARELDRLVAMTRAETPIKGE